MVELGDSFMLSKSGRDAEHLWVLITRPDPKTREAIMVNVTTQRPHSDTTTILNAGVHRFIKKPSVVFYADARVVDVRNIENALIGGACRSHEPFSNAVIAAIQEGIMKSPHTPKKIQTAFLECQGAGLDRPVISR